MINKWQKITEEYKNLSLSINTRIQDNYHSRRMHNIFYKWVIDLYTYLNYDILKLGSLFIEFYEKNKKLIRKGMLFDSISLNYNKNDFELLTSFLRTKNISFNIEFSEYELWNVEDIETFDKIITLNSEEDLVIKFFWFTVYHYCPIEIMEYISLNPELDSSKKIDLILKNINYLTFGSHLIIDSDKEFKNALEDIFQRTGAQFFALEDMFQKINNSELVIPPFTFSDFREYSRRKWDSWIFKSFEEKNKFLATKIKIINFENININPNNTSLLVGNGFSIEMQTENWLTATKIHENSIKNYSKVWKSFYDKNKLEKIVEIKLDIFLNLGMLTQNEYNIMKHNFFIHLMKDKNNLKISDMTEHIILLKSVAKEIIKAYKKNDFSAKSILKFNLEKSGDVFSNRFFDYNLKTFNKIVTISEDFILKLLKINWNEEVYYEDLASINQIFLDKITNPFNDFHFIFNLCYLSTIWNEGRAWNINFIKSINIDKINSTFKGNLFSTNYDGFLDLITGREVNHLHGSFNLWKCRKNNSEEYIKSDQVINNFKNYLDKNLIAHSSIVLTSATQKNNFLDYKIRIGFKTLESWINNYKNDKSKTLVVVGNNFFKDHWIYDSIKNNNNLKRLVITFFGSEEKKKFIKEIPIYLEKLIRTDIEIILCDSKTFFEYFKTS